jgi:hypothetical protein
LGKIIQANWSLGSLFFIFSIGGILLLITH